MLNAVMTAIDGTPKQLADYRGKALLIVNTASKCGYTRQYAGLQQLYERYKDRGLVVLGFPSNDFGGQEPGAEPEIQQFCSLNFGVTFPLFAKVSTKGKDQSPLYHYLTKETPEGLRGPIRWNFTKFLVDPAGEVVGRWDSRVEPLSPEIQQAVEQVLPAHA